MNFIVFTSALSFAFLLFHKSVNVYFTVFLMQLMFRVFCDTMKSSVNKSQICTCRENLSLCLLIRNGSGPSGARSKVKDVDLCEIVCVYRETAAA